MRTLGKMFDCLEEILLVLGIAFMTVMNFVNVVSRYCFTNSFSFTEELTVMAFVWITMFGVATGFKRYAHLGMSYFTDLFPRRLKAYMSFFYLFCAVLMIAVLIYEGIIMVKGQIALDARTPALGMPTMYQGLAMPVGGVFILIRVIQAYLLQYRNTMSSDKPMDDAMTTEARALAGMDDAISGPVKEGRDGK